MPEMTHIRGGREVQIEHILLHKINILTKGKQIIRKSKFSFSMRDKIGI